MEQLIKDGLVNLDELAEKGGLFEDSNGHYRVKNKYITGDLVPAEQFLTAPCGIEFHTYVRKKCRDTLYYHPNHQERVVEHQDLWPGRRLEILFFNGGTAVWVKAAVGRFKASINSDRGSGAGHNDSMFDSYIPIQYSVMLNFNPGGDLTEGAVVELKGLKGQQQLNGIIAVVTGGVMSGGRYPVQCWDGNKTDGHVRVISVKPENMKLRNSMWFDLHRISIEFGGILVPADDCLPKTPRLSFKWTEQIPEAKLSNWGVPISTPRAEWRKPFDPESNESVEVLKTVYEQQVDRCLQREDEDEVAREIDKLKDRLIESAVTLTTYGSPDGLRAALRDLLAMPLAVVILAANELVHRFDHCHILQLMAAMYEYVETNTNGFSEESFDPRYTVVYAQAGIKNAADLRRWGQDWYLGILRQFCIMGEFRAVGGWDTILNSRWEATSHPGRSKFFMDFVVLACLYSGVFPTALELCSHCNIDSWVSRQVTSEINEWSSTAGHDFALKVVRNQPDRIYSPDDFRRTSTHSDNDEDKKEECVNCGKLGAQYTCAECQVPRFCSRECQLIYWQQVHIDECGGPPKLGEKCAVCNKATDVACMACLDVYYCSDKCQAIDWERGHKDTCEG